VLVLTQTARTPVLCGNSGLSYSKFSHRLIVWGTPSRILPDNFLTLTTMQPVRRESPSAVGLDAVRARALEAKQARSGASRGR
jgi:hypothetical protein